MINIRSKREIDLIRNSCRIVVDSIRLAEQLIEPGVETGFIDKEIENFINAQGAKPAFKGYKGFPASACISVEEEVVHGIPGNRKLVAGEIVSVDVGVLCEGYYGDSARTFTVGDVTPQKAQLMDVTLNALDEGVKEARSGARLSNISHRIQSIVEQAGFSVVRDLVGHGIGQNLHEEPQIPNYGQPDSGPRLREGMVLAIEPMVNMGSHKVKTLSDDWTIVCQDGLPSAHFEYTVVVTSDGPDILTKYD